MSGKKNKVRERKNLLIANMGDVVVIKNRAIVGNAILGAVIMAFCIGIFFMLKAAWDQPIFWIIFLFIFLSTVYSFANNICGRIVLRSKTLMMTVYNPFKKEYKFSDINYVDMKSSKPQDGYITHSVIIYIGTGKKSIKIDTFSRAQADELLSLIRGMLDNAAMEYPEGNEEPFEFAEDEKKSSGIFAALFKKRAEEKTEAPEPSRKDVTENAESTPQNVAAEENGEDKNDESVKEEAEA